MSYTKNPFQQNGGDDTLQKGAGYTPPAPNMQQQSIPQSAQEASLTSQALSESQMQQSVHLAHMPQPQQTAQVQQASQVSQTARSMQPANFSQSEGLTQQVNISSVQPVDQGQVGVHTSAGNNVAVEATAFQSAISHQEGVYSQDSRYNYAYEQGVPAKKSGKGFVAGFLGAALALCLALVGLYAYQNFFIPSKAVHNEIPVINVDGEDVTLASAVASVALPSVVSIDVYEETTSSEFFFGNEAPGAAEKDANPLYSQISLGSGVVISADGYIITNNHVIEGSDYLVVTINGEEYEAEFIGADASSDIAVIKANAQDLTAIKIGKSADMQIGDWVMSLGNPFGLENSVSVGIVSALQRSSTMVDESGNTIIYPNMIQTDAVINPGNSGGPLVNQNGELIGINSMITSYSGSSSGVGFAIPIDYAYNIAKILMEGGTPTHAQLGVSLQAIDTYIMEELGLNDNSGAYIAEVYEGSAAAAAGIKKGDIIVRVNEMRVESPEDLQSVVRSFAPGDEVEIALVRGGKEQTIKATLKSDEQQLGAQEKQQQWGYSEENEQQQDAPDNALKELFDIFR